MFLFRNNSTSVPILWTVVLSIIFLGWFSILLGNRPLATPDEGRYVEIPREMIVSGDYITPRLNGVKYFEKPPLFYWLQSLSIKLAGLNEAAMRFWTVFFAAFGCLVVTAFSWKFFNPSIGLLSGGILAFSPLYYALSRLIILDMSVSILLTTALLCFIVTVYTPPGLRRRLWAYGFYTACALGVLTKGIMTLALAGPIILLWAFIGRKWYALWPAYLPTGVFLFLGIAAPWHILASLKNPEFAYKYFIVEHVLRYTTSMHLRTKPVWFFIPIVILGFFPWISLLFAKLTSLKKKMTDEQQSILLFLWIWIGFVLLFFSAGDSKLIPYILPIFPAMAIITACTGYYVWKEKDQRNTVFLTSFASLGLSIIGLIVLQTVPDLTEGKENVIPYVYSVLSIFATGGILGFIYRQSRWGMLCFPFISVGIILTLIASGEHFQKTSLKPIAKAILEEKKSGDLIVSYLAYHQDLPVYLQQTITVVEAKGELTFGTEVEDTSSWMITKDNFIEKWTSSQRLLVVVRENDLNRLCKSNTSFKYKLIKKDHNHLLITNKEN